MAYSTINKSTDYFNTKLYTGDGNSTQAITGVGHQPDLVWLKNRSDSTWHQLIDAVRGTGAAYTLASNSNEGEGGGSTNQYGFISALSSDGFTVSAGTSNASVVNHSGNNYASWNWKAGGSASSNTDGSITSSVSANTTAGFSIVSYTGTGANATIGHGLGSAPKMVIVKDRDNGTYAWHVYHVGVGATKTIYLNATNTPDTSSIYWNNTAPTSSVFSVGTSVTTNNSGDNFIAYCFAEKTGYSKFGSYVGNGNADGSFIYTGFKPAWVMLKKTNNTESWLIMDNKRQGYNPENEYLIADLNNAEGTPNHIDLLSNGFKLTSTGGGFNGSGDTFIYMAFGQSLVGSNNVPCTAR